MCGDGLVSRVVRGSGKVVTWTAALLLLAASLLALARGCDSPRLGGTATDHRPLVGAYYYVWYDDRQWAKGYLGRTLEPPVTPLLGEYSSADPLAAAQHIRWASEHGIDVFLVSWAGRGSREDRYLQAGLLSAPNLQDIRFAIFYESQLAVGQPDGRLVFDQQAIDRLVADAEHLARHYLAHPRYLRIEGRPVLFLYLTRLFEGRQRDAIRALRRRLGRLGHAVYLVGDEVYWHTPEAELLRRFDAITAYNMYDGNRSQFAGYAARSAFFPEIAAQYRTYRRAAIETGVGFIPSVLPGYNDRGVRPRQGHYVIPRRFDAGAEEGSVFARAIREHGLAFLDDRHPLLVVTTFNEWHEWSQIEPTWPAPATARDVRGGSNTSGFPHQGYGTRYLEALRDAVVAVSGRVVKAGHRSPAAGAEIRALRNGRVAATIRADSTGHYRFARSLLPPGRYELAAGRRRTGPAVDVGTRWTGPVELEED